MSDTVTKYAATTSVKKRPPNGLYDMLITQNPMQIKRLSTNGPTKNIPQSFMPSFPAQIAFSDMYGNL